MIEYQSLHWGFLGLVVTLLWMISYFRLFKKTQLYAPPNARVMSFFPKRSLVFLVGFVGMLLMSYAMTGPRKPLKYLPSSIEVNDIFFVIDVSRSMLADDLPPNRLEVAKQKLREFAALRPTDRIGVIIFSEKVFTMLPLTTDPLLIDQILAEIRIGYLGSGTNIGDALGLAVARGQMSETKNKVIVLLTDGVSNYGNITPINAAKQAKDFGIKVYTIGIGTHGNGRLPVGRNGRRQRYQAIPGGSIDVETLEQISKLTGGKSYLANSENSLKEILSDIQNLEKTKVESQSQVIYDEKFFEPLFWGVLLFLLHELLRRFWLREVL